MELLLVAVLCTAPVLIMAARMSMLVGASGRRFAVWVAIATGVALSVSGVGRWTELGIVVVLQLAILIASHELFRIAVGRPPHDQWLIYPDNPGGFADRLFAFAMTFALLLVPIYVVLWIRRGL